MYVYFLLTLHFNAGDYSTIKKMSICGLKLCTLDIRSNYSANFLEVNNHNAHVKNFF